jgi:glycerol-3-phosphate responsive antiterminator
MRTIQRIHALDSTGLETGLNSMASPAPLAIAVAPALTLHQVVGTIRKLTSAPIWGTGFVTTPDHVREVLSAGAEVVTSSRPDIWREFRPT